MIKGPPPPFREWSPHQVSNSSPSPSNSGDPGLQRSTSQTQSGPCGHSHLLVNKSVRSGRLPSLSTSRTSVAFVCPTRWRSAAGRPPARPLQHLISGPTGRVPLTSSQDDLLVAKGRHEVKLPTEGGNVPAKGGYEALLEILSPFESRDVRLVHRRVRRNFDLGLPYRLPNSSNRKTHSSLGATTASKDPNGLRFRNVAAFCCRAHFQPTLS